MRKVDKSKRFLDSCKKAQSLYGTPKITKDQARESGLMFYFGTPCPSGHDGYRYVSNNICRTCSIDRGARWNRGITESEHADSVLKKKKRDDILYDLEISRAMKEYDY